MASSLLSIPPKGAPANAALWQPLYKFLRGEDTTKRVLMASDDDTNYVAWYHNEDTTNGRGLLVTYGDISAPTTLLQVDKSGIQFEGSLLSSGQSLSAQASPGKTLSIDQQSAYTQASVFALEVVKKFHGTGTSNGSANMTVNQLQYDATTNGSDATTTKMTNHWTGTNTTVNAVTRVLEIEAIRYAATAGTGAATALGAVTAASMAYGSMRGIDIGLGHDPAITDPADYITGLVGVNVFNVGAASVDGKTWASGGNQATCGVVVWGDGGFNYGFVYNGPGMADQNLHTTTGRVWHVREAGGIDQMWLSSDNTTGTGWTLNNSTSAQRAINLEGSAASFPGAIGIWNASQGRYVAHLGWRSAVDTAVDQCVFADGTAAVPGITFASDIDVGLSRTAANTMSVVTNGAAVASFNATGLGIGAAATSPLTLSTGATVAISIAGAANFTTTVGAAGGASAIPTPVGYLSVILAGSVFKIPYCNP